MRAALYTRVSTDDQAAEGFSLDAQMKRLEAYCRIRGWDVAGEYREEGYSGRNIRRPEYERMFSESDSWDVLLVLKMDRIHRNSVNFTRMMDDLRARGKEFSSVQEKFDTTTAMGRFVMDIMQRIAQLESEQVGERTFVGMEFKAKAGGGHLGSAHPYGYIYRDGRMDVLEDEASTVRTMYILRSRGSTAEDIATFLNDSGVPSKKGGRWSRQAVSYILKNPLYAGFSDWNGIVRPGDQPPIVDRALFERLNGPVQESRRCAQRYTPGCPRRSRPRRATPSGHRRSVSKTTASWRAGRSPGSTRTTATPDATRSVRDTAG